MEKEVMLVMVMKRQEEAVKVQEALTKYGCVIKTRLGLHESASEKCENDCGLIILELTGDKKKRLELEKQLKKIKGTNVKSIMMKCK